MLFVISPAKTLEFGQPAPVKKNTIPQYSLKRSLIAVIVRNFLGCQVQK